jgi:outer membrane protein assembly factor BamE
MKKFIITILVCFGLIGCTDFFKPYCPPVQQGNVITDSVVHQIKPGMTKFQVADKLGEPVLINPFEQNMWTYVYTFQPSKGPRQEKRLLISFQNEKVCNIIVDLPPPKLRKKTIF